MRRAVDSISIATARIRSRKLEESSRFFRKSSNCFSSFSGEWERGVSRSPPAIEVQYETETRTLQRGTEKLRAGMRVIGKVGLGFKAVRESREMALRNTDFILVRPDIVLQYLYVLKILKMISLECSVKF